MILDKLLNQENKVLANWSKRKKRFDECQQFILFEKSAQQTLEWINETGENYLNTHVSVGSTRVSFVLKSSLIFDPVEYFPGDIIVTRPYLKLIRALVCLY